MNVSRKENKCQSLCTNWVNDWTKIDCLELLFESSQFALFIKRQHSTCQMNMYYDYRQLDTDILYSWFLFHYGIWCFVCCFSLISFECVSKYLYRYFKYCNRSCDCLSPHLQWCFNRFNLKEKGNNKWIMLMIWKYCVKCWCQASSRYGT